MRFLTSTVCTLLTFTTSVLSNPAPNVIEGGLEKRQGASIVYALQQVQSGIQLLNQRVYYFDGNPVTGALDAIQIQQQTDDVGRSVEYATQVANYSPPLDESESLAVATQVLALRPDIKNLLLNIASKKPAFDHVVIGLFSVSGQVKKSLQDQKALTVALGYAIAEKLTGAFKAAAPQLNDELAAEFDAAIAAFVVNDG